eukprot:GSMAST32.ASY1.ANO1.26.1 assembled CDS
MQSSSSTDSIVVVIDESIGKKNNRIHHEIKQKLLNINESTSDNSKEETTSTIPEIPINPKQIFEEIKELKTAKRHQMRDSEHVCFSFFQYDVIELLKIMGIPYVLSPSEAEAQCAELEMKGLVYGTITDDSDIFLFGGKRVFRNIFADNKFVEEYKMSDIEKGLGLSRKDLIHIALLLGSDYTDGVKGIGIVNACEVVSAFPNSNLSGLEKFGHWANALQDPLHSIMKGKKTLSKSILSKLTPTQHFMYNHRKQRRVLPKDFPNPQVITAYMSPVTEKSDEIFQYVFHYEFQIYFFFLTKF